MTYICWMIRGHQECIHHKTDEELRPCVQHCNVKNTCRGSGSQGGHVWYVLRYARNLRLTVIKESRLTEQHSQELVKTETTIYRWMQCERYLQW